MKLCVHNNTFHQFNFIGEWYNTQFLLTPIRDIHCSYIHVGLKLLAYTAMPAFRKRGMLKFE